MNFSWVQPTLNLGQSTHYSIDLCSEPQLWHERCLPTKGGQHLVYGFKMYQSKWLMHHYQKLGNEGWMSSQLKIFLSHQISHLQNPYKIWLRIRQELLSVLSTKRRIISLLSFSNKDNKIPCERELVVDVQYEQFLLEIKMPTSGTIRILI